MILAPLTSLLTHCPDPRLVVGLQFLANIPAEIAPGRHELDGGAYVMIDAYDTVGEDAHPFEAHRQYVDIHMMLDGAETIQWAPLGDMREHTPYNEGDDYALYTAQVGAMVQNLVMRHGLCAVFYPEDAHKPGLVFEQAVSVRKAVVKLPVS